MTGRADRLPPNESPGFAPDVPDLQATHLGQDLPGTPLAALLRRAAVCGDQDTSVRAAPCP